MRYLFFIFTVDWTERRSVQSTVSCGIVFLLFDMRFNYLVLIETLNLLFLTADFAILSEY